MYAFASNDYLYYKETGLILSYLSCLNAESMLAHTMLHYCIISLIHLTTYLNLNPCANGYNQNTYNTLAGITYRETYTKGECAVQYQVDYKEVKWFKDVHNRVNG